MGYPAMYMPQQPQYHDHQQQQQQQQQRGFAEPPFNRPVDYHLQGELKQHQPRPPMHPTTQRGPKPGVGSRVPSHREAGGNDRERSKPGVSPRAGQLALKRDQNPASQGRVKAKAKARLQEKIRLHEKNRLRSKSERLPKGRDAPARGLSKNKRSLSPRKVNKDRGGNSKPR